MTAAYRLRSGHTTDSLNENALLLQGLLLQLLDRVPVDEVTDLVIDCNGHDIINFGVSQLPGRPTLKDDPFFFTADTTRVSADSTEFTADYTI